MGKRKSMSSKMAPPKKAAKVEMDFCCPFCNPFCNHAGSVECSIDVKHKIAEAPCFVSKVTYSTVSHALTEPIDIYSEWIDECERANEGVVRASGDDDKA